MRIKKYKNKNKNENKKKKRIRIRMRIRLELKIKKKIFFLFYQFLVGISLWPNPKVFIPSERMHLLSSKQERDILSRSLVYISCFIDNIFFIRCLKTFLLNTASLNSLKMTFMNTFFVIIFINYCVWFWFWCYKF